MKLSKNQSRLRLLTDEYLRLEKKLLLGGGPSKIEKIHSQGKLTARERIDLLLDKDTFFRTHRQYLINKNHIKRYIKGDGSILVMTNDGNVPIARNRKDEFNLLFTKL